MYRCLNPGETTFNTVTSTTVITVRPTATSSASTTSRVPVTTSNPIPAGQVGVWNQCGGLLYFGKFGQRRIFAKFRGPPTRKTCYENLLSKIHILIAIAGSNRCTTGNNCVSMNFWYWQCQPVGYVPSTNPAGMVASWNQCGGQGYIGRFLFWKHHPLFLSCIRCDVADITTQTKPPRIG
jgi:hypothetical protein